MKNDAKTMERARDLQSELGAVLDRFHTAGMEPLHILQMLNAEAELWLARSTEQEQEQESA